MRRLAASLVVLIATLAGTALLYGPVLGRALIGDDYQWVQHAHHALHEPILLLADLDSFYRPASTWTLALDLLVWGFEPLGFRVTNLLLHALAGALLWAVARRLGLGGLAASAVATVWLTSPFAFEPAASVAIRFQSLLLISWWLLILAWPGPGRPWTGARGGAVAAAALLAMASKETWVVTPLLALALEWGRGCGLRTALRTAVVTTLPAAAYTAAYFVAFPGDKSYYHPLAETAWKVPHELAAFLHLETLRPLQFTPSGTGAVAALAAVMLVALALRRRLPAGVVGAALLASPTLPTLLVPYLPTRYTTIPYAGFLLLVAAVATFGLQNVSAQLRRAAAAAVIGIVALVAAAGVVTVRADLHDVARLAAAHERLVEEARAVADEIPLDRPVLVVRAESVNPLVAIAGSPRGLPKLLFPRPEHPYALIDSGALLEWAMARPQVLVDDLSLAEVQPPAAVLVHLEGRFAWAARAAHDLGDRLALYRRLGLPVVAVRARSVRAEPLSGASAGAVLPGDAPARAPSPALRRTSPG